MFQEALLKSTASLCRNSPQRASYLHILNRRFNRGDVSKDKNFPSNKIKNSIQSSLRNEQSKRNAANLERSIRATSTRFQQGRESNRERLNSGHNPNLKPKNEELFSLIQKSRKASEIKSIVSQTDMSDNKLISKAISQYVQIGHTEDAVNLYHSVINPDMITHTAGIKAYAYYKNIAICSLKEAEHIFQKLPRDHWSHVAWDQMMNVYTKHSPDKALSFFKTIPKPTAYSISMVLKACRAREDLNSAVQIIKDTDWTSIDMDPHVYSSIIGVYCENRDEYVAERWLKSYERFCAAQNDNPYKSIQCYAPFITLYTKTRNLQKGERVFSQIQNYIPAHSTIATFGNLANLYDACGQASKCDKILDFLITEKFYDSGHEGTSKVTMKEFEGRIDTHYLSTSLVRSCFRRNLRIASKEYFAGGASEMGPMIFMCGYGKTRLRSDDLLCLSGVILEDFARNLEPSIEVEGYRKKFGRIHSIIFSKESVVRWIKNNPSFFSR